MSPEASHQSRGEVVRHRTAKLHPLEAGTQAEERSEPDDLGDSHLDEADIGSYRQSGFPVSRCLQQCYG